MESYGDGDESTIQEMPDFKIVPDVEKVTQSNCAKCHSLCGNFIRRTQRKIAELFIPRYSDCGIAERKIFLLQAALDFVAPNIPEIEEKKF